MKLREIRRSLTDGDRRPLVAPLAAELDRCAAHWRPDREIACCRIIRRAYG